MSRVSFDESTEALIGVNGLLTLAKISGKSVMSVGNN
jgi:hypothetical protein